MALARPARGSGIGGPRCGGGCRARLFSAGLPFVSDPLLISLLNALSVGLLLFMLAAGLSLILGLMGVLNMAHAGFYLLGAYAGHALTAPLGYVGALMVAPVLVGLLGAALHGPLLRPRRAAAGPRAHAADLLVTWGLGLLLVEAVQLIWGRSPLATPLPELLQAPAFTLLRDAPGHRQIWAGAAPAAACAAGGCIAFPASRVLVMGVALTLAAALWLFLRHTRSGLIVQAALTHPQMVAALGHDVTAVQRRVFGLGCAMAALAGAISGSLFTVEPSLATQLGPLLFVVLVIGGSGSLAGALLGSLLVGALQTLPLAFDLRLVDLLAWLPGMPPIGPQTPLWSVWRLGLPQLAGVMPYLMMIAVLVWRPHGLLAATGLKTGEDGTR
ncbi:MAG: hypothetical protein RIQ53_2593 [Pseudomonadota bacterium]|jgi:branched-chain amino acid transport system permease protein